MTIAIVIGPSLSLFGLSTRACSATKVNAVRDLRKPRVIPQQQTPDMCSDWTTSDQLPLWHADVMDDRTAIIDLAIAYTWALDSRNIDGLDEVFTPDATGMLHGVACEGRDAIKERIGGAILRFDATQHLVGNHQVSVDGDEGTHRCQLQGQHVLADTEGGDTFIVGGYYEDRVVRTADGWRIAHRLMQQTWTSGNPAVVRR